MSALGSFIYRIRRDHHLRKLNRNNAFAKLQAQHLTPKQKRELAAKKATADQRALWLTQPPIIDMHETGPDSAEGQAFLATLTSADIHYLACALQFDGRFDEDWALAFVAHPDCDLGTAWHLFLVADTPMEIESYLRDQPDGSSGIFAEEVRRNDAILARMQANAFKTREFAPSNPKGPRTYRSAMAKQIKAGASLRWQIPKTAFDKLKGRDAQSRLEKTGDQVRLAFEVWQRARH